jgi:hypothetical protein
MSTEAAIWLGVHMFLFMGLPPLIVSYWDVK